MPTPALHYSTPYERLHHHSPNYQKLLTFGCLCYPWHKSYTTSKLQPQSTPCVFLGYSNSQSAYKCYDFTAKRLYLSRHVNFVESVFPFRSNKSMHDESFSTQPSPIPINLTSPPVPSLSTTISTAHLSPIPPTSPLVTPTTPTSSSLQLLNPSDHSPAPSLSHPDATAVIEPPSVITSPSLSPHPSAASPSHRPHRTQHPNPKYFNNHMVNSATSYPLTPSAEPTCVTQAMKDPNWHTTMSTEFNALIQNGT